MPHLPDPTPTAGFATRFAEALLDSEQPVPLDLRPRDGSEVARRFAVYRNNVMVGLIDALADIFPATRAIVGNEFFRAMARIHVAAFPPRSRLMLEYGRDFPGFIQGFEPARKLPYLGCVAKLERAWLDAYHAGDVPPLDLETLAAIDPEILGEVRFSPHPALRIVRSRYAVVDIFRANRSLGIAGERIDGSRPQIALVTRPHLEVRVEWITPACAAFVESIAAGMTLADAVALAATHDANLDLAALLGQAVGAGAFATLAEHEGQGDR
jgi:hypothetical protein